MKGSYLVTVKNRRLQYKFTINRNITILHGDSATGKTTLIDMIHTYQENGEASGVSVTCECNCAVLTSSNWQINLASLNNTIVFIDEGNSFILSKDFAQSVKNSTNYYVIATRNPLFTLPYSITEIYGIKNDSANKYQGTKRLYSSFYPLYSSNVTIKPDLIIVEDSNSGFAFFENAAKHFSIPCISAKGKAKIHAVAAVSSYDNILIIADGAAFGSEIERIMSLRHVKNIGIYMPESFEWLILKSDVLNDSSVDSILANPSDFIESQKYLSWEQFFTSLLIEKSQGTYLEYKKSKLNPAYLQNNEMTKIISEMPEILN